LQSLQGLNNNELFMYFYSYTLDYSDYKISLTHYMNIFFNEISKQSPNLKKLLILSKKEASLLLLLSSDATIQYILFTIKKEREKSKTIFF